MYCTPVTLMYLNEGAGNQMYVWSHIFLNTKESQRQLSYLMMSSRTAMFKCFFFFNIKRKDDVLEKLTDGSETDTRVKSKISF